MAKTEEDLFNEYYTEIADQINDDHLSGEYPVRWEVTDYTIDGVAYTELSNWLLDPVRETVANSVSDGQISGVDIPCYITKGTFDYDEETLDIVTTDLERILKVSKEYIDDFKAGKYLILDVDYTIKIDTDVDECKGKCKSKGKGKRINEISDEVITQTQSKREADYDEAVKNEMEAFEAYKASREAYNRSLSEDSIGTDEHQKLFDRVNLDLAKWDNARKQLAELSKKLFGNLSLTYKHNMSKIHKNESKDSIFGSLSKSFDASLLECDKIDNKEIKDFLLGKSPKDKKAELKEDVSFTEDDYNELVNELRLNTTGLESIDVEEHDDNDYYISVWVCIDDDLHDTYDHDSVLAEIHDAIAPYDDETTEMGDGIVAIFLGVDPDISDKDKRALIEKLNKIRPIVDKYYKDED